MKYLALQFVNEEQKSEYELINIENFEEAVNWIITATIHFKNEFRDLSETEKKQKLNPKNFLKELLKYSQKSDKGKILSEYPVIINTPLEKCNTLNINLKDWCLELKQEVFLENFPRAKILSLNYEDE